MKSISVKRLVMCALFAALTAVCSQIQIPLPMIPINLALFAVLMCGALMRPIEALMSMAVYVLMGLCGLPVFTGMAGGPGVLFGKTGGYIMGYILCGWLVSLLLSRWGRTFWKQCLAMALGVLACYAFGSVWFMVVMHMNLWLTLTYCVFPFLIGDALKILLAALLSMRLWKPFHAAIG